LVESFRDENALVGVAGHRHAPYLTTLGLQALQARGRHGAGLVCSDGNLLRTIRSRGSVSEVFTADTLRTLVGRTAIGQVVGSPSMMDDDVRGFLAPVEMPLTVRYSGGQIGIAMTGRLTNGARLRGALKDQGAMFSTLSDAETLLHLVARSSQHTFVNRLVDALWKVEGSFCVLVCTEECLVAVRDPRGFRPLVVGEVDRATVVATEASAIELMGGQKTREIAPGEMLIIDDEGPQSVRPFPKQQGTACSYEFVGLARDDSEVFDTAVYPVRIAIGERLAQEHPCAAPCVVVSVPGQGEAAAVGYARKHGMPYRPAIQSNVGSEQALDPAFVGNGLASRLQWRVLRSVVQGQRVVLVTESLLTGRRLEQGIQRLREAGALEVHLRVASPPVRSACFYGVASPATEELLVSRCNSMDEVARQLSTDSLGFLSLEGFKAVVGLESSCNACLTGVFPIAPEEPVSQLSLFD
jgi:amidophosphoribosyltransferase